MTAAVYFPFIRKKDWRKQPTDEFRGDRDQLRLWDWNQDSLRTPRTSKNRIQHTISTDFWNKNFGTPWNCFKPTCFLTSVYEHQLVLSGRGNWELGGMEFASSNDAVHISSVVQSKRKYWQCFLILKFD